MTLNTAEQAIADRIFQIKSRLCEIEKKYDLSGINEERVKLTLELESLDEKHFCEPEVKPKEGLANNE